MLLRKATSKCAEPSKFSIKRVQDAGWIHGCLRDTHQINGFGAMLRHKKFLFAFANAVLTRARTLHGKSALGNPGNKCPSRRHLFGIFHHHEHVGVEMAVPSVRKDWCNYASALDVLLRLRNAFRQPRNGYADICDNNVGSWPDGFRRPKCIVSGAPETCPVL